MERRPGSPPCASRHLRLSWKPADALLPPSVAPIPQFCSGRQLECSDNRRACCGRNTGDLLWGGAIRECSLGKTAAIVLDSQIFMLCVFEEKGVAWGGEVTSRC